MRGTEKAGRKEKGMYTIEDIMKVLPHRYPFQFIDRVLEVEDGKRIVAVKNVSINVTFASHSAAQQSELLSPNDSICLPAENHGNATLAFTIDGADKSYNEHDVELWMNESYTFSIQPDGSVTGQH